MASWTLSTVARIATAAVFATFVNVCVPAGLIDLLVTAEKSYYAIALASTRKARLK